MSKYTQADYMDYIIKHDLKEEQLEHELEFRKKSGKELHKAFESRSDDLRAAKKDIDVLISGLKETRKELEDAKGTVKYYCDENRKLRNDIHSAKLGLEEGDHLIKNYRRIIKDIKKISFVPGEFSKSKLSKIKNILEGVE